MSRGRQKINLVGQRFGRLLVLKEDGYAANGPNQKCIKWLCQCDCGKTLTVLGPNLRKGNSKSCGCGLIKLLGDEVSFRETLYIYKRNARVRALIFDLTSEMFRKITSSDCKYCGAKPNKLARARKGTKIPYIYNGIDRVDNQYGYTPENCVPCCETCNHMKCKMDVSNFLEHTRRIAAFCGVN